MVLDTCRRLKSEVHAYTRRTISRTRGESEGTTETEQEKKGDGARTLPLALFGLAAFCQLAGVVTFPALAPAVAALGHLSGVSQQMAFMTNASAMRESMAHSKQKSIGKSWSEAGTVELLN